MRRILFISLPFILLLKIVSETLLNIYTMAADGCGSTDGRQGGQFPESEVILAGESHVAMKSILHHLYISHCTKLTVHRDCTST